VVHGSWEEHLADLERCTGVQGTGTQETSGLPGSSSAFGDSLFPVITIVVDVSGFMEALTAAMEFLASLVAPYEEEIMRWEDDGGR